MTNSHNNKVPKELDFLEEYKKLCLEYDMEIRGCGDCGSAWLEVGLSKRNTLTWNDGYTEIQFGDEYDIKHAKGKL